MRSPVSLFQRMREGATFINTGRGAQVVEADLIRVLRERPDVTALLDVTFPEPPDADSALWTLHGVQWFMAFLIKFLAETKEGHDKGAILLFDELGLHLHPQGQRDLLRLIEDFSKNNQIISTRQRCSSFERASNVALTKKRRYFPGFFVVWARRENENPTREN